MSFDDQRKIARIFRGDPAGGVFATVIDNDDPIRQLSCRHGFIDTVEESRQALFFIVCRQDYPMALATMALGYTFIARRVATRKIGEFTGHERNLFPRLPLALRIVGLPGREQLSQRSHQFFSNSLETT